VGLGVRRTREGLNAPVRASWSLEYTFALTQGSLCLECQPFACLDGLYAEADVLIAVVCFLCRCNNRRLCRWRRASFRTSGGRLLSRAICLSAFDAFWKSVILCVTGDLRRAGPAHRPGRAERRNGQAIRLASRTNVHFIIVSRGPSGSVGSSWYIARKSAS
jgi:hypothetical protein